MDLKWPAILKKIPLDLVCCCTLSILILFFLDINPFNFRGDLIGGTDIGGYFYWNAIFTKEALLSGTFPLWNPHYCSGHPFFANPQTFVLYPATLLYVFLPLSWAFNVDYIIHFIIAAIGMYFFLQSVTRSRYAGLASAIIYSLSGYFGWRVYLGHITLIHAAALVPWIFYFIERSLTSNKTTYIFITGIILGMQILGGDPQVSYYTSLFLTLYYFLRWFSLSRHSGTVSFNKATGLFVLIPLIAFGISAIQILPTIEFRSLSPRSMNTYEYATFLSFPPLNFFHFIAPYYFSPPTLPLAPEFGCYIGISSIILAFIGGAFSLFKKHSFAFGIMLFVAATFVLGCNTPVYFVYYNVLPLLSTFRVPARCMVLFIFIMSILAGFGIHHLCEFGLKKSQKYSVIIVLVIISVCIIYAIYAFRNIGVSLPNVPNNSSSLRYAILFTFASFVIVSTFHFIRNKHILAMLFLAILYLDLYSVCSPLIPKINEKDLLQENAFERTFKSDPGFYRVNVPGYGDAILTTLYGLPNHATAFHYYGINGNLPFMLTEYYDFISGMAGIQIPEQHRHSFPKELFFPEKVFSSRILGTKYAVALTASGFQMLTAKEVQPHAILINEILFTKNIQDQLQILRNQDFNPKETILIEESAKNNFSSWQTDPASLEKGTVTINAYFPNRIELTSNSPINSVLLLSELYYPGWKAYIDGEVVPILRADYLLRAIRLSAGQHRITFSYKPMSFYVGSTISIFTILILTYLFYPSRRASS